MSFSIRHIQSSICVLLLVDGALYLQIFLFTLISLSLRLQVAAKFMPVSSVIIGVDLLPIRPITGVIGFQGDITSSQTKARIRKELAGKELDLVIHDGAPNVGGAQTWQKDALIQNELVLHSVRVCCDLLKQGGTFVTKVCHYLAFIFGLFSCLFFQDFPLARLQFVGVGFATVLQASRDQQTRRFS